MRAGFQSQGAAIALAIVSGAALTGVPASAQQAKPKPGVAEAPRPAPPRYSGPVPPIITPEPPPGYSPAPRISMVTNPSWARSPMPEYPAIAMANGVNEGRATLRCRILPNGSLADCLVVDENPRGQGFGKAALAAATTARISPRTVDGAVEGATVQFAVRFLIAE